MWKKPDNLERIPPDSSSDSASEESISELLMSTLRDASKGPEKTIPHERLIPHAGQEAPLNQQALLPPMLREYTEAVEKCRRSASEFIRCAALLSEARDAYQKLMTARTEIRRVLESDELTVRALMSQVQTTADDIARNSPESFPDRKPQESSRVSTSTEANNSKTKLMMFRET